jgi:hypothetical protein
MSSSPAYLPLLSVWAFRRRRPTMPAADSCTVVNFPCGPFSPDCRTPGRPPEVSSTAFATRLPDLPPRLLMVMDFAITCLLVQPGRPRIWFLFVRSWLCYALLSDPASRRRPCASLILRHHQAGQGTFTPELLSMLGTQEKKPATAGLRVRTLHRRMREPERDFSMPVRLLIGLPNGRYFGNQSCKPSDDRGRVLLVHGTQRAIKRLTRNAERASRMTLIAARRQKCLPDLFVSRPPSCHAVLQGEC